MSLFFPTAMTQSEQWKASWIFHSAPMAGPARVLQGARRLVVWRYLIPFFTLLFVLLSFRMPVLGAAVFILILLMFVGGCAGPTDIQGSCRQALAVAAGGWWTFPFSCGERG